MNIDEDFFALSTSVFSDDFCSIPLEPLSAFCDGIEADDIDKLLEKFEESEKLAEFECQLTCFDDILPMVEVELSGNGGGNSSVKRAGSSSSNCKVDNKVDTRSCCNRKKVEAETRMIWSMNDVKKVKKKKMKGVSLLAKPPKNISKVKKHASFNSSPFMFIRFAAYFYQHHDYCTNPNKVSINSNENSSREKVKLSDVEKVDIDLITTNQSLNRCESKEIDYNVDNIINLDQFDYKEMDINCDLYDILSEEKGLNEVKASEKQIFKSLIKWQ